MKEKTIFRDQVVAVDEKNPTQTFAPNAKPAKSVGLNVENFQRNFDLKPLDTLKIVVKEKCVLLQVVIYEIDTNFCYLSHKLTCYCLAILCQLMSLLSGAK